ncbi:MAG TPA: hypothetical protein VFX58_06615 [Chitinophagaceae bacterium]|nr:hypothetical protein [Chitinophagaceae bacterium]
MSKTLLLIILFIGCQSKGNSQDAIFKIAKHYYRSEPFEKEFSQFLHHLINDPLLSNKTIHKKTDSTLFFLEGTYLDHRPFFFRGEKSRVILAEKEQSVLIDSINYLQTIYVYQLIGYAPRGAEGVKDVEAEFEKFSRRYKNAFPRNQYREIKRDNERSGQVRDYAGEALNFFPLTIAWASSQSNQENIFAITIRFMVDNNRAHLPKAFYGF